MEKGSEKLCIQVGKTLDSSGFPVARERLAIYDLLSCKVEVLFVPYEFV